MDSRVSVTDEDFMDVLSVKAQAFDAIAKFMDEAYGDMSVSNVAPEEAHLIGIIRMANRMIEAFSPIQGETE